MAILEAEIPVPVLTGAPGEPAPGHAGTLDDLRSLTERMATYIVGTGDYTRTDRLWPADAQVFATNPMSIAHGAAGVALFLDRALGEVPDEAKRWMRERRLACDAYPPGLYLGLAGIAYAFWEIGMPEEAERTMRTAYDSPLLFDEAGMYLGAAGWGWASLYFWERTGTQLYLDRAVQAGEHVLRTAEPAGEGLRWRYATDGDRIHYGYGFGAAGVGLFLMELGLRTGRGEFLSAAERAMEHELASRLDSVNGITWKRFEDDVVNYPYFQHGSAGIGSVAVRMAQHLDRERWLPVAREIADAVDMKWTVFPGVLQGMAGIAEFMLDMHRHTSEAAYRERALDQADTILWFQIPARRGIAFPGRMLLKVSTDWGTGAAGIGLFLHRLAHGGPRLLLDLDEHPGKVR